MAPKIERKPKSPEAAQDPDKQRRLRLAYSNKLALLNAVVNTPQYAVTKKEVDDLVDQMEWEPDPTPIQHSNEQSPPPAGGAGQQPFNNGQSPPPAGQQPFNNGQSPPPAGQQPFNNGQSPPPAGQQPFNNGQSPPPAGQQPFNNGQSPPPAGGAGHQPFNNGQSPPPAGGAGHQPFNNGQSPPPAAGQQTWSNNQSPSPAPSDSWKDYGQWDVDNVLMSLEDLSLDNEIGTLLGHVNCGAPGYLSIYQLGGEGQFKKYYSKITREAVGIDLVAARKSLKGSEKFYGVQGVVLGSKADISSLIPSRWRKKVGHYGDVGMHPPFCLVKVVFEPDGPAYWMTRATFREKYDKNRMITAPNDFVHNGDVVVPRGTLIGYADLKIISVYIANQRNYGLPPPRSPPGTFRRSPSVDREGPSQFSAASPPRGQPAPGVQFSARPATRLSPQIPPSQGYQAPVQPGQVICSNAQPQGYQAPVQPGQVIYSNTQPQGYQAPAQPGHVVYPCLRAEAAQWISAQGQPVYPNNQPQAVPGSWSPSPAPTAQPGPVIYADNGAPVDPVAQLLHHGYWTGNSQSQPIKQEAA